MKRDPQINYQKLFGEGPRTSTIQQENKLDTVTILHTIDILQTNTIKTAIPEQYKLQMNNQLITC